MAVHRGIREQWHAVSKQEISESDICDQYITPAMVAAGWHMRTQIRREYSFTAGRIIVRGQVAVRGQRRRADYLLFYQPNLPIAVVEAKDNNHAVGGGMQQALAYAEALDRLGEAGTIVKAKRVAVAAEDKRHVERLSVS